MHTFIARQPIFDRTMGVYGYELLHRSSRSEQFECSDPDRATVELLEGSMLVHQLDDLTGGKLGFVNVPRNLLGQDFLQILPPDRTVIEVLETVRPEAAVVRALEELKAAGYRIALDDFVDEPDYAPLVRLADIIKVDWLATPRSRRVEIARRYGRPDRLMLAEKVETRGQYEDALECGYDLFQGYFFCRPEVSARRNLPTGQAGYVRFLREISRDDLSLDQLEDVIKKELSLSARLLRYLNSAHFGVLGRIDSIHHALVYLGERATRRWGTLIALASLNGDKPQELVRTCLVRARFCEQAAERMGRRDSSLDLYMTGLFSAIDAVLDRPLDDALRDIGLPDEICKAIRGEPSALAETFALAVACERGDVGSFGRLAGNLGLAADEVAELYADALFWADSVFRADEEPQDADGEGASPAGGALGGTSGAARRVAETEPDGE